MPSLDKRVTPRYRVGPGHYVVYSTGGTRPVRDLGLGGVFIEDRYPSAVGTPVHFVLQLGEIGLGLSGVVQRCIPGEGMGVQFQNVSREAQQGLERYLTGLAKLPAAEPAPPPAPSRAPAKQPQPPPASAPEGDAPAVAAEPEPAPLSADPAPGESGLSPRLAKLTSEVRAVEEIMKSGDVDTRVLAEFRRAVDQVRLTAWVVQQWFERQAQQKDPYTLLPQLTKERMRRMAQLSTDLALDIDTAEVTHEEEGIVQLSEAVGRLHERLLRIVKK